MRENKLTVMLSDDELAMLRELASSNGQTVSDWIRQLVRREHADTQPQPKKKRPRQQ